MSKLQEMKSRNSLIFCINLSEYILVFEVTVHSSTYICLSVVTYVQLERLESMLIERFGFKEEASILQV